MSKIDFRFVDIDFLYRSLEHDQHERDVLIARHNGVHAGYVYFFRSCSGLYKIGQSKNPEERVKTFGPGSLIAKIHTDDMTEAELCAHRAFNCPPVHTRLSGEWFQIDETDTDFKMWIDPRYNTHEFVDDFDTELSLLNGNIESIQNLIQQKKEYDATH